MSEDRTPTSGSGQQASPRTEEGSTAIDLGKDTAVDTGSHTALDEPRPAPTGPVSALRERVGAAVRPVPPRPARYAPRPQAPARATPRRRARLAVTRIDPWSVFVLALLVSIFLGVVLLVAAFVLYGLLSSLGVLDSINSFAQDLQIIDAGQSVVTRGQVLAVAAVVAAVDVVLLTVLATLAAFLYNVCASLTGGIEVALAERD